MGFKKIYINETYEKCQINGINELTKKQNKLKTNYKKVSLKKEDRIRNNLKISDNQNKPMTFRLRPSSKKSTDTQNSLVQFPKAQTFINNDVMTLKQLVNKIQMLQNNVNILTQGIRRQRQISSAGYIQTQKRLDVLEYKSFTNQKDIHQLAEINRTNYNQLAPLKKDSTQSLSKNQMAILKQTILQQRQSQKQHSKHLSQTLQQMSMKQLRLQQELREMFNRTRVQHEDRISQQTQQLQRADQFKIRKIDNQYELIRQQMQLMQKKIVEDFQAKLRKQIIIKQYVQEQVNMLKQQMMQEQRSLVSTEVKLTREMKQSLESLYAMIGQMKVTFGEELSETQQLTSNNIKRMAMNLDVIDGKYQQRLKQIEQGVKQTEQEMVNFRQWVVSKIDQNRQIVMGLEQQAIQRMQNSQGQPRAENGSSSQSFGLQQKLKLYQNQMQQWKSSIQQKNITIFKEISQSLKQIKLDYKKQNDEVSSELISLTQSLKQLKKSLPSQMKKISQTIVTIFNDQFDILAEELDLLTQMIKVAKAEGENYAKNQIKKHKEEFLQEIKVLIQGAKKQVTLGLQKSIIKSEESLKTLIQKESQFLQSLFNQRVERLQSTNQQLQTQSKKLNTNTTTQLQNFSLSMKQFNQNYKQYLQEQRKQDLKKRIELQQNMRKNATNLMDLAYKKSEFLVEGMKKAIEMNEMKKDLETKQAIQGVKDDLARSNHQNKEQLINQLKALEQKLNSQRKSSEKQLQDQLKQNINTLNKTLAIQIGNTKLSIDDKIAALDKLVQQKINIQRQVGKKTDQKIEILKKQVAEHSQKLKKSQQKIQSLKNQLTQTIQKLKISQKQQINIKIKQIQTKLEALHKTMTEQTKVQLKSLTEKQIKLEQDHSESKKLFSTLKQQIETQKVQKAKEKQLSQTKLDLLKTQLKNDIEKQFKQSAQKSQESLKEYEETLNTLRQTVWKLQAMNFSQQAKNKAIFDKINEDLNHITVNMDSVSKQIKTEQKKKQTSTQSK